MSSNSSSTSTSSSNGFGSFPLQSALVVIVLGSFALCYMRRRGREPDYTDEEIANHIRDQRRRQRRAWATGLNRKEPQQVDKRYSVVEKELISKNVHAHDEHCSHGHSFRESLRRSVRFLSSEDEEIGQDCAICYEAFQVGETVSLSSNPSCNHVFHHQCVKSWLLDHIDCPICRSTFLPSDQKGDSKPMIETPPSYFCVQHGLVRLPSDTSRVDPELVKRSEEKPDADVLRLLRPAEVAQMIATAPTQETDDDMVDVELGVSAPEQDRSQRIRGLGAIANL